MAGTTEKDFELMKILEMGGRVTEVVKHATIDNSERYTFTVLLAGIDKVHYQAEYNSDGALRTRLKDKMSGMYKE